jgi:nucleoside-diphosphate-sugar epimerase
MHLFITGHLGFIGSILCEALAKRGHKLTGFDKRSTSRPLPFPSHQGDVLDKDALHRALSEETECILHLAAEHKDEGPTREDYFRVNQVGTHNLLEVAGEKGVKRFFFFSSVAVYGHQIGAHEETQPAPVNAYGASKLAAEEEIHRWAEEQKGRQAIILRPTVVFGPRNQANIFRLMKQVAQGRFLMVGKGDNIKSVTYVENTVEATLFLLDHFESSFDIYNQVDYPQLTISQFVALVERYAQKKRFPFHMPLKLALAGSWFWSQWSAFSGRRSPITPERLSKFTTITHFTADKLRRLGYIQPFSLEEGIRKTVEWNMARGWQTTSVSVESEDFA